MVNDGGLPPIRLNLSVVDRLVIETLDAVDSRPHALVQLTTARRRIEEGDVPEAMSIIKEACPVLLKVGWQSLEVLP